MDYLKYQKYKNKYLALKNNNIQSGGHMALQTAWVWFLFDPKTQNVIYNCAQSLKIPNLNLKSEDNLHISLLTIHSAPNYHNQIKALITSELNKLDGRDRIVLKPNETLVYLPSDNPKFVAISFTELGQSLTILRFKIRQLIIAHFKNYFPNMYSTLTKKDQQYKDYPVYSFDAIRFFDATSKNELCNFRLDEYDETYHVSLNTKFDDKDELSQCLPIKPPKSCVKDVLQFDRILPNMFEYKIRSETGDNYFFIHNIKINNYPVQCGTNQENLVTAFLMAAYGLQDNDIRISTLNGSNPPCGGSSKNLLQIHILKNIPSIEITVGEQLNVNSQIGRTGNIISMKIKRNK